MAVTYVSFDDQRRVGGYARTAVTQLRAARESLKKLKDICDAAVDDPTNPTDFTVFSALLGTAGGDSAAFFALITAANNAVTVSGVNNFISRAG